MATMNIFKGIISVNVKKRPDNETMFNLSYLYPQIIDSHKAV